MKQKFTYYLHGPDECSLREWCERESGLDLTQEQVDAICDARPFYEVGIECEVDEKGKVTLLGVQK
jgi:hypothetical protein